MLNNIDWRFLKRSLILLAVAIVFSASIIMLSLQYEGGKYQEYKTVKSSLSKTHGKYKKLVDDLELIHQYTQTYNDYRVSGLVGPERRLSWIETLETVNEVLKLPRLSYTLSPQQGFKRPMLKVDKAVRVNSTPMELDMDMLHEEDLFAVLEGIDGVIENLYTLDSCRFDRIGGVNATLNTKSENIQASCLMRWVTIDAKEN